MKTVALATEEQRGKQGFSVYAEALVENLPPLHAGIPQHTLHRAVGPLP